jgi:hypothetical protein
VPTEIGMHTLIGRDYAPVVAVTWETEAGVSLEPRRMRTDQEP